MCLCPIISEHPIIFNNLFTHNLSFQCAIPFLLRTRCNRQALAFQRYIIPLMTWILNAALRITMFLIQQDLESKPSTALTGNIVHWHSISPVHNYLLGFLFFSSFSQCTVFPIFWKFLPFHLTTLAASAFSTNLCALFLITKTFSISPI